MDTLRSASLGHIITGTLRMKVYLSCGCIVAMFARTGIQYLRDFLHLPQEIVPATLKRPVRTETARAKPKG